MPLLNPTPPENLVDAAGRPYFLWDVDLTLAEFEERLAGANAEDRAYWLGKLMRQAKPDDVFSFARPEQLASAWPLVRPYLGDTLPFWHWLLRTWNLLP